MVASQDVCDVADGLIQLFRSGKFGQCWSELDSMPSAWALVVSLYVYRRLKRINRNLAAQWAAEIEMRVVGEPLV